jgi:hypothetical protein
MTDIKFHDGPDEGHAWAIRAWHLAILRFTVTLEDADEQVVLTIATGIDRLSGNCDEKPQFSFFRRTSAELCASIRRQAQPTEAVLRDYLARIDDIRLKRALIAAIGIEKRGTTMPEGHPKPENKLWRRLPSRNSAHP